MVLGHASAVLFFILVHLCLASDASSSLEHAVAELRPLLSSNAVVSLPNSTRFSALEIRASSPRVSPGYGAIIEVATEKDVQIVVKVANRHDVPFLSISGAHGWTRTLNKLQNGIQINMRRLNNTVLGVDGKTSTVGGGTLQYEITRALLEKGNYAGELDPLRSSFSYKSIMLSSVFVSHGTCRVCIRRRTSAGWRPLTSAKSVRVRG